MPKFYKSDFIRSAKAGPRGAEVNSKPAATADLEWMEWTDASLLDLFLTLTLDRVEQDDDDDDDEQLDDDDLDEEGVRETVDEVESFEGDSHWFFLTRGNVPGGPIMGGASR